MMIKGHSFFLLFHNHNVVRQAARFTVVGIIATGIHYGIYWGLTVFLEKVMANQTISASIAYTIGYFAGFCVNYFLTTYFTFRTRAAVKNIIGFGISHILNYFIEIGTLNLLLVWKIDKTWAGLITMVVAVPLNFMFLKVAYYLAGRNEK